jgi:hypothetical protein
LDRQKLIKSKAALMKASDLSRAVGTVQQHMDCMAIHGYAGILLFSSSQCL